MTAIPLSVYAAAFHAAMNSGVIWASSTHLTLTLHTSTYTPDLVAHTSVADLTNELGSGSGYTAGGVTLTSATTTVIAANSWTTTRANTTAYAVGQVVRPTAGNGYLYRVVIAGTSGGGAPVWPTVNGQTVTDGGVTWSCVGTSAVVLDAADLVPAWAAFAAGPFRHVVLSDRAQILAANQPLIGVYTFQGDQTGGGGAFNITFDAAGIIVIPVP